MNARAYATFSTCLENEIRKIRSWYVQQTDHDSIDCGETFRPGYRASDGDERFVIAEPEWSPEGVTFEDVARGLLESHFPPQWIHGVIWTHTPLPLPGGPALKLLPALCALGSDWGCPENPLYPGEPTPDHGNR